MKEKSVQMSESLPIALLLACVGGFLETYSFFTRDGVFANCQTGNLVLLAMYLVENDWERVLSYTIPVLSFILGVILTDLIRSYAANRILHWRQYIVLLEALLLAAAGLIPSGSHNIIATTLIAFSCSMQVEAFRKVKGAVYATTMCTGNLRSGTFHLFSYFSEKNRESLKHAGKYFSVIAVFMGGAILGSLATELFQEKAVWLSCLLLLLAFILLFIRPAKEQIVSG